MDGVFMFKLLRLVVTCILIYGAFCLGSVVQDRQTLSDDVIRLHIVAASNSEEDQAVKLQIRDAVVEELRSNMEAAASAVDAKAFLLENMEKIESIANTVLEEAGFSDRVRVTLDVEAFETRVYDTFTLPAGVYESLRIVVGEGEGENWWCVVFPRLCMPKTVDDFADVAVGSGFSDTLTGTLKNDEGYEIRFFVLDCLGRMQNFFFRG